MKIKEIVGALERFAPLPLQDGFDNAGLQVGLTDVETTGALLCLDVTENVVDEAIRLGYNLIISHHPLIFKGLKSLTGRDYIERCMIKAIKNDIVIYSSHTNLDNVQGGVNYKIAEKIGLRNIRILQAKENSLLKLVTFVPVEYASKVKEAFFHTGCGNIGNYDSCSYSVTGEGSFRAKEGADPFCGAVGEIHVENEIRIETILPAFKMNEVLKALVAAHPYEEPAYDFYSVANKWQQSGSGVVGELEESTTETEFLERIKAIFEVKSIKHTEFTGRSINKVALCGGSGAFLLNKAIAERADVFLTGEVKYHDFFGHETDLLIAEIGHYESEQYTQELLLSTLKSICPALSAQITTVNTNPIKYF